MFKHTHKHTTPTKPSRFLYFSFNGVPPAVSLWTIDVLAVDCTATTKKKKQNLTKENLCQLDPPPLWAIYFSAVRTKRKNTENWNKNLNEIAYRRFPVTHTPCCWKSKLLKQNKTCKKKSHHKAIMEWKKIKQNARHGELLQLLGFEQ